MSRSGGWKAQSSFRFQNLYALKCLVEHSLEDPRPGLRFERILLEQPLLMFSSIEGDEREVDFVLEFHDKQKNRRVYEIYEVKSTETNYKELRETLCKFHRITSEGTCTLIVAKNAPGKIIRLIQDLKDFQGLSPGTRKIKEIRKKLSWCDEDKIRELFGGEESFMDYLRNIKIEWGEGHPDALVDRHLSRSTSSGRLELGGPAGFCAEEIKNLLLTELEKVSISPEHTSRYFTRESFLRHLAKYSAKNYAISKREALSLEALSAQEKTYYFQISGEEERPAIIKSQVVSVRARIKVQNEQNN